MAKTIKIAIHTSFHTPSTTQGSDTINIFRENDTTATQALVDTSNASTTFTYQLTETMSPLNQSSYASGDKHTDITQDIIKGSGAYESSATNTVLITNSGGDTVTSVKMWGASAADDAVRQNDITHNSNTLTHDARDYGAAAPVEFTSFTASPMTFAFQKKAGSDFAYLTYIEITYGPTITSVSTDDTVSATENPWSIVGTGFGTD